MYEERRIQINWKNILFVVGVVALIIVVIMLLVPKNNMDAYYSQMFKTNLNTMKEAAKSYYVAGGNMPENIGESSTINLENMVSKKLVTDFVDKNNKSCNKTNSYAQITKTGSNEYVLKTQLSCDADSDYVLETISSTSSNQNFANNDSTNKDNNTNPSDNNNNSNNPNNDEDDDEDKIKDNETVDKDGNVIKTVKEYEFKKPVYHTKNSYRCEDGYKLEGTTCYKYITGEAVPATPTYFEDEKKVTEAKKNTKDGYTENKTPNKEVDKVTNKCPDGYTENNNTCVKYQEATVKPGTTTYSCPDGYNYNSTTKKCERTITKDAIKKETTNTTTSCVYAFDNLTSAGKCTYSATVSSKQKCECPDGSKEDWWGKCVVTTTTPVCKCPDGYTKNGSGTCSSNTSKTTTPSWDNAKELGKYPTDQSGYTSTGKITCNKTSVMGSTYYSCFSVAAICSTGTYNGQGSCVTSGYSEKPIECKDETSTSYVPRNNCKTETSSSCDYRPGVNPTLSSDGTTCSYNATTQTKTDIKYECESGYTLDSTTNTCKKVDTVEPTKNTTETEYSCPAGWNREGTTCYTTAEKVQETTYKYTCPDGFTPNGSGENMTCTRYVPSSEEYYCEDADAELDKENKTCTKVVKGQISGYKCPNSTDYVYDATTNTCVKKTLDCKDAIVDTEETVTYEYKWSTSEYLEGWTRTGNVREKTTQSDALIK